MATLDGNLVNSVKSSCSQHRAKYVEDIIKYVDSKLTMRQIAAELGISYQCVRDVMMLLPGYQSRVFANRSNARPKESVLFGRLTNNGRTKQSGYYCFRTPSWYDGKKSTGRGSGRSCGYVFEHTLIMCAELNVSNLGKWLVHHEDQNKLNNELSNLVLIQRDCHSALHTLLRKGVTTIPIRKYTQVGGSARLWSFNVPDEDIVYSSQRWLAVS
jgi:hypothetical protein